ncbi:MAG: rhodanese-like domain-containing protein [Acidimicrobiales bacterium]
MERRSSGLDSRQTRDAASSSDKDRQIVTYCSNTACNNSSVAETRLRALGYRNVRKYPGGKQDWIEAGLPVEAGARSEVAAGPRPRDRVVSGAGQARSSRLPALRGSRISRRRGRPSP